MRYIVNFLSNLSWETNMKYFLLLALFAVLLTPVNIKSAETKFGNLSFTVTKTETIGDFFKVLLNCKNSGQEAKLSFFATGSRIIDEFGGEYRIEKFVFAGKEGEYLNVANVEITADSEFEIELYTKILAEDVDFLQNIDMKISDNVKNINSTIEIQNYPINPGASAEKPVGIKTLKINPKTDLIIASVDRYAEDVIIVYYLVNNGSVKNVTVGGTNLKLISNKNKAYELIDFSLGKDEGGKYSNINKSLPNKGFIRGEIKYKSSDLEPGVYTLKFDLNGQAVSVSGLEIK